MIKSTIDTLRVLKAKSDTFLKNILLLNYKLWSWLKKNQSETLCLMLWKSLITMILPSSMCYEFMNFR